MRPHFSACDCCACARRVCGPHRGACAILWSTDDRRAAAAALHWRRPHTWWWPCTVVGEHASATTKPSVGLIEMSDASDKRAHCNNVCQTTATTRGLTTRTCAECDTDLLIGPAPLRLCVVRLRLITCHRVHVHWNSCNCTGENDLTLSSSSLQASA